MNTKYIAVTVISALTAIIGVIYNTVVIAGGNNPLTYNGGTWYWVMILGAFIAEITVYISWKLKSSTTSFWAVMDRLAIFMIIYTAILYTVDNLLYLLVLGVVIWGWNKLYEEVGGIGLRENSQTLALLILIRVAVRPVLRVFYLLLSLVGVEGDPMFVELRNFFAAIIAVGMAWFTYQVNKELL